MNEVTKHLRIRLIEEAYDGVIIEIVEEVEEVRFVPEDILPTAQTTDEERVVKRIADALRKQVPELFGTSGVRVPRFPTDSPPNRIYLTMEEYWHAGSPTVGDYIKLLIQKEKKTE